MATTEKLTSIPILLLKTRSNPADSYAELLSRADDGLHLSATFVPVLEHKPDAAGVERLSTLLEETRIGCQPHHLYGGLIFTSQRAVEAFASIADQCCPLDSGSVTRPSLQNVPVYSVGPATTKALKTIKQIDSSRISGGHTGTGEKLAEYILEHYGRLYHDRPQKPALLFLVGEQRRDIIPNTLMCLQLAEDRRIPVDELVVYQTGEMASFDEDFARNIALHLHSPIVWIAIFSPAGCKAVLEQLGLLDEATGKAKARDPTRTRFIISIGPTTRDYLIMTFGFAPDVCAAKPSPEGILEGISQFMKTLHQ